MNLNALTDVILFLSDILVHATQLRVERHNSLNLQEWTDICGCCHDFAIFDRWNANEAGEFIQIRPDYNETQTTPCDCGSACGYEGLLVNEADMNRERGSVTIARRRLKVSRMFIENRFLYQLVNTPRQDVERKCTESVSAATERAIVALADRYYLMQDGEREQQDIFEAQMIRLGDLADEIEEWEQEQLTYCTQTGYCDGTGMPGWETETVTIASQPSLFGHSIRRRYRGHYGY